VRARFIYRLYHPEEALLAWLARDCRPHSPAERENEPAAPWLSWLRSEAGRAAVSMAATGAITRRSKRRKPAAAKAKARLAGCCGKHCTSPIIGDLAARWALRMGMKQAI
jgi:hypothetical protein